MKKKKSSKKTWWIIGAIVLIFGICPLTVKDNDRYSQNSMIGGSSYIADTVTPKPIITKTPTKFPSKTPTRKPTITSTIKPTLTKTQVVILGIISNPTSSSNVSSSGCPNGCTSPPSGCNIKGNISISSGEKIYHMPGMTYYDETEINPSYGERWFCTEEEAVANGWRKSKR